MCYVTDYVTDYNFCHVVISNALQFVIVPALVHYNITLHHKKVTNCIT